MLKITAIVAGGPSSQVSRASSGRTVGLDSDARPRDAKGVLVAGQISGSPIFAAPLGRCLRPRSTLQCAERLVQPHATPAAALGRGSEISEVNEQRPLIPALNSMARRAPCESRLPRVAGPPRWGGACGPRRVAPRSGVAYNPRVSVPWWKATPIAGHAALR